MNTQEKKFPADLWKKDGDYYEEEPNGFNK